MSKILIVDDDKNFIETLRDSLKEKDIDAEIVVSTSAKATFDILSNMTPDVIILDIQLEDMHGFEFLKIIKNTKRLVDTPVIFISAKYTEPMDRTNALLNGAKAFFSKPVDIEDLWNEIKYLISKK
jgi:DNA-binding response OmpR family regulator